MFFERDDALTSELLTPIDYIRFGLSKAAQSEVWYGHGTDNAWDEMFALVLGSLKLPPNIDPMILQARLTITERQHLISQLKKRLLDKIPVPYLTQEAFFCGESYYVDERVLIPRSPIAELIEQRFEPWVEQAAVKRILDLCTGSGCIAIACAYVFPHAHIDAVDISEEALAVAGMNVNKHHMSEAVSLIQSDLWTHVPKVKYDVIVSNPPYVSTQEMATLPAEYKHEPNLALEAKDNGLALVREILKRASDFLSPKGVLVVEVGNSEPALVEALPALPFTWLEFERGGEGVFILTAEQLRNKP